MSCVPNPFCVSHAASTSMSKETSILGTPSDHRGEPVSSCRPLLGVVGLAFRRRGDAVQPESAELLVVFGKGPLSLQNHHLTCSWCMLVICSGDATDYVGDDA